MNKVSSILEHLAKGQDLSVEQASMFFGLIMTGEIEPAQAGAFLLGLRTKGETAGELSAAVNTALQHARLVTGLTGTRIDTCGTGGDGRHSFNCSTAVSFSWPTWAIRLSSMAIGPFPVPVAALMLWSILGCPWSMPRKMPQQSLPSTILFFFCPLLSPGFSTYRPHSTTIGHPHCF